MRRLQGCNLTFKWFGIPPTSACPSNNSRKNASITRSRKLKWKERIAVSWRILAASSGKTLTWPVLVAVLSARHPNSTTFSCKLVAKLSQWGSKIVRGPLTYRYRERKRVGSPCSMTNQCLNVLTEPTLTWHPQRKRKMKNTFLLLPRLLMGAFLWWRREGLAL